MSEEDATHIIYEYESLVSWRNTIIVDGNPEYRINQNKDSSWNSKVSSISQEPTWKNIKSHPG